tara:strand:+ start:26525 stop:27631 length:1107 start_codon:yes stop_codon:yes gene_type:complete
MTNNQKNLNILKSYKEIHNILFKLKYEKIFYNEKLTINNYIKSIIYYLLFISLELKLKSLTNDKEIIKSHSIFCLFENISDNIKNDIIKEIEKGTQFTQNDLETYLKENFSGNCFKKVRNFTNTKTIYYDKDIIHNIIYYLEPIEIKNNYFDRKNNKFSKSEFMTPYVCFKVLYSIYYENKIDRDTIKLYKEFEYINILNQFYYYFIEIFLKYLLEKNNINIYEKNDFKPHNIKYLYHNIPKKEKDNLLFFLKNIKTNNENKNDIGIILKFYNDIFFRTINLNIYDFENKILLEKSKNKLINYYFFQKNNIDNNIIFNLLFNFEDEYIKYRYINENSNYMKHNVSFLKFQKKIMNILFLYIKNIEKDQ